MVMAGHSGNSGPSLVDELESAFQNCLAVLNTQEYFNASVPNESRPGAEQCIQKFLVKAREIEAFFLQRRVMLSIHKPEQFVKEDIQELKAELVRKEALIQKYYERLQQWPAILQTDVLNQQPGPHPNISPGMAHHPGTSPGVAPMPMGMGDMMPPQANAYPHGKGPLSYLEQSMSSIGVPEHR